MKKLISSIAIASGFSFAIPMIDVEASIGVWNQSPKGYIQYPSNTGNSIDLENDLNLGDETKFSGKLKIELPILPKLYLQYTDMEFTGKGNLQNIRFGDYIFNASVDSKITAKQYDIGLYYNIPLVKTLSFGAIDPEIGVIVKILDFEAVVSGQAKEVRSGVTANYTEKVSQTVPIPLGYAYLGINFPTLFGVWGELKGIKYDENYFYEYALGIRVRPIDLGAGHIFVEGGYRFQRLRLKDVEDITADIKVGGFFGNIGISF
ncbi:MAG: hypothetical protein DSY42_07225 [Aquifex sp.]|nr:MAG: hypothetical protein DSY42_07225 [Aquifex sp.]